MCYKCQQLNPVFPLKKSPPGPCQMINTIVIEELMQTPYKERFNKLVSTIHNGNSYVFNLSDNSSTYSNQHLKIVPSGALLELITKIEKGKITLDVDDHKCPVFEMDAAGTTGRQMVKPDSEYHRRVRSVLCQLCIIIEDNKRSFKLVPMQITLFAFDPTLDRPITPTPTPTPTGLLCHCGQAGYRTVLCHIRCDNHDLCSCFICSH